MRLIKIDDVIKKLNDAERRMDMRGFYRISVEIRSICSAIKRLPTIDAEPVVWCKDCIKRNTSDCAMWYKCEQCGGQWSWETNNDYCSYGTKI